MFPIILFTPLPLRDRRLRTLRTVHNFMDYSDDDCRWEFTIRQSERADMVVAAWHPGYLNPEIRAAITAADPQAWAQTLSFQSRYQTEKLPAFQKALEAMEKAE